jgi:hypothetical protein
MNTLTRLYLANTALLIAHEIDSAYWHEWELFHLPGGIQLFVVLNLLLVLVFLWGIPAVVLGQPGGRVLPWLLAGAGLLAPILHGVFLAGGDRRFRNGVSLSILGAMAVVSTAQAVLLLRQKGRAAPVAVTALADAPDSSRARAISPR